MLETMTEEEIAQTLRLDARALTDIARTIAQHPGSTIEPARRGWSDDPEGRRALAHLGEQREHRGIASGLELDRTIGEGGMGVVRLATQRSLGRAVAVKTLRPEARTDAATLRLLREAWVTGSLEHPNIVPVYDLGLDDDGSPIIVLKRIEGVEWASLLRDDEAIAQRFGAADPLEHNLRVLVQVCNAVSLAHARGVVHRDLKPENVMIGSFGEVYVVDWGIAVALTPDPAGRLPLASAANEMAGTPCYMAPEMLGALGAVSVRTDVYLLGAILHEILTGRPPHDGTFKQIIGSILLSSFEYPESVPGPLADIAKKAMSRDPERRYASADELRLRVEWYLRHRGALALATEARRRLVEMRALVATASSDAALRDRLYHLFAECRFGFRQAMNACEDSDVARAGLREAIITIVEFELASGTPEAASGALVELEDPPAELVARVNEAHRARAEERTKLARFDRMQAELDPSIGRRTRAAALGLLGIVWTVAPQVAGALDRRHPNHPYWMMYAWTAGVVAFGALVVLWGRESLTKTAVNRNTISLGMVAFATQLVLQVGCHVLGLGFEKTMILHHVVWGAIVAVFAALVDRRFWPAVAAYFAAFVVAAGFPAHRWNCASASNFVLLVCVLVAWWRPYEDRPRYLIARQRRLAAERAARRSTS